jgi:hypothetical protein
MEWRIRLRLKQTEIKRIGLYPYSAGSSIRVELLVHYPKSCNYQLSGKTKTTAEDVMAPDLKENLSNTTTWGRALFMILFAIIYSVAEVVIGAVVVIQFFFVLFSGATNHRLLRFGSELSRFIYQVFLYLTYNREDKPFPFADWPSDKGDQESGGEIQAQDSEDEHTKV